MDPMDHGFTQPHPPHDDGLHGQYPELGFMSPSHSGHQGPGHRLRHGSGHSELETEEGGPSVQYPGNYYGEREQRGESDQKCV